MRALAPSLWAHAATYVHATPSLTPTN
jgi:hypothetical protein